jgi:protein TonB
MGGYNHWRRALVLSALIHCVLLAGFAWLSPFAGVFQPKLEYIEMELADSSTDRNGEPPAPVPAVMPLPSSAELTPERQISDSVVAQNVAVSTNINGSATNHGGSNQGIAAPKQPGGGSGLKSGGIEKSGVQPPKILQRIDPVYPEQARRQGWEGRVVVRLEVLPSGVVGSVSVERSSGYPLLDETAVQAVREWRFVPAKDTASGSPIPCTTTVPLVFRLN